MNYKIHVLLLLTIPWTIKIQGVEVNLIFPKWTCFLDTHIPRTWSEPNYVIIFKLCMALTNVHMNTNLFLFECNYIKNIIDIGLFMVDR